jgi:succinyl-CoA synthetase beta subunit
MKLYEYQAKRLFKDHNIPIPDGVVCSSDAQVREAFPTVGKGQAVMLKSQLLVGGRGKSGGIRAARTATDAGDIFRELMDTKIRGYPVSKVLVEEKIQIKNEYYVGITIDPTFSRPILLLGSRGGVEVETIAKESPSALGQTIVNPRYGVPSYQILRLMEELGLSSELAIQLIDMIKKLYSLFAKSDATLTEINPLVETRHGRLVAVDARLNIDQNALFKHPEFNDFKKDLVDDKEILLKAEGVDFVDIGGNVGLICAGAGMTMATMDLVDAMGGKPACFCDVSAGINPQSMEVAIRTVSDMDGVASILVNMFGGLTRMDQVAASFIAAWQNMGGISLPIVIRLEGTNGEEGRAMMKEHGFETFTDLYDAVKEAVQLGST